MLKMNKMIWTLTIIVLMSLCENSVAKNFPVETHEQKLVFTTPEQEGLFTEYQREIFKELSKRTGFECILKELPKKVCLISVDSGLCDGVAARVKGIEAEYPNLIMLGVSHFTVQHVLFARNPNIIETVQNVKGFTELVIKTKEIVGFLRGSKKAKTLLTGVPDENVFPLDSPEKGFELLQKGRIAIYLAGPGIVNRVILKEKFHESGIKEICVISETQLFPYLNVKHSAIIPKFNKALQAMLNDGTIDKIRNSIE